MPENETDLVKTTYLDALAVLQQEKDLENRELKKKMLAERKSQNEIRKKGIDKKWFVIIFTKRSQMLLRKLT